MAEPLERERELATLTSLDRRARDGEGPTVVIEGHPGLGKSTLVAELRRPDASVRILFFRCGELERQLPWAGAVGLLGSAVAALPARRRSALLGGPAAAAAALFAPAVAARPRARARDAGGPDRFGVLAALQQVTAAIADGDPLLLVIDDAHWCDRPSLNLLAYLQRRLGELRAGLVLATRPPAIVDRPQRAVIEQIMSAPGTEVLTLAPLGPASVARLVHDQGFPAADDRFCETCFEVTAGNPFFLHELLLELRQRGGGVPADLDAEQLSLVTPPAVQRSLLLRLARLPVAGAAALAGAVAILGEGATLHQAASLADLDPADAVAALDALTRAELLVPGEPLRFVHPLVRGAIDAEIPPAARAERHARAAALLAAGHAPPHVVALHLLHAPRLADPRTVAGLRAGAEHASRQGAPRSAMRYLLRALEEPPTPEARPEVLIELARAETAYGGGGAIEHLTEALELTDDPRRRAELHAELGWLEHHAGRFPAAAVAFERGLELLRTSAAAGDAGDVGDRDLADRLEAGYLVAATLDSDRVADANARIQAIEESESAEIRSPAHRMLLTQMLFLRTMSGAPHGAIVDLALRLWGGGRMLLEEGADSGGIWHVIGALSWADAYEPALRAIEQTLVHADERGLALAQAQAHYARAWPRFWMGDLRGAQADGWTAIQIWEGGFETYLPAAVYWYGLASLELGQPEKAAAALARCAPFERWRGTGMAGFVHGLEGALHLHHGRVAEAVASHRACGDVMTSLMIANPSPMPWRSAVARALCLLGPAETDAARQLAAEEFAAAETSGAPRAMGVARATLGLCTPGEEGIAELTAAAAELGACEARLEQMRALVDLGARLRRAGRPREARPPLREGLELAQAAGAVVLARRAETELRAAGARGRRTTDGGPHTLTASEQRVAELAAGGHTNREIAGLLQISVKAVEWHLHQSYRKLDIRGRSGLTGALGS